MITQGVDLLVIASIDGEALTSVLEMAEASNIPVVAYDRLIMNSEHVSYYATFDNYEVGVLQGQYIEESLGLADGEGPFKLFIQLFCIRSVRTTKPAPTRAEGMGRPTPAGGKGRLRSTCVSKLAQRPPAESVPPFPERSSKKST